MRRLAALTLAAGLVLTAAAPVAARSGSTIVDIAIAVNKDSGEFSQLIAAADRAGLVGALDGKRKFTVFAPTDAAFQDLYDKLDVSGVNEIPLGTLKAVLLHHVSPGERFSGDVLSSSRVRTLNRDFVFPSVSGGTAFIDGAAIITPDIDASNGVIHVIDEVLLP